MTNTFLYLWWSYGRKDGTHSWVRCFLKKKINYRGRHKLHSKCLWGKWETVNFIIPGVCQRIQTMGPVRSCFRICPVQTEHRSQPLYWRGSFELRRIIYCEPYGTWWQRHTCGHDTWHKGRKRHKSAGNGSCLQAQDSQRGHFRFLPTMVRIVRTAVPNATMTNGRFHVQKFLYEAIDKLRITYRWMAQGLENDEIQ